MDANIPTGALTALFDQLSERQAEVLRLLGAHKTAKEIGRDLGISEYTVRAHATEARKRLGANTLREALILLARFEAQSTLVSNWQSQPEGIAPDDFDRAGLVHEYPSTQPFHADHANNTRSPETGADVLHDGETLAIVFTGNDQSGVENDGSVRAEVATVGQRDRMARGALFWIHTRFKTLTGPNWLILIGASTLLVLLITVGVLAGAGAVLQTIQDLGVRAR